jgi:hypothetical protein
VDHGECFYAFDTHLLAQEVCGYVGLDDAPVAVFDRREGLVGRDKSRERGREGRREGGRRGGGEEGEGGRLRLLFQCPNPSQEPEEGR